MDGYDIIFLGYPNWWGTMPHWSNRRLPANSVLTANEKYHSSLSICRTGALLADRTIAEIAKAHGKSAAQVILRWHLQRGIGNGKNLRV